MKSYVVNRILWLQVITVALLLAALAAFGLYAAAKHDAAQKRLDQAEPRYARLMGLIARREDIGSFSVQANESISRMAYPSSQDATQTGNEAQQRLRSIWLDNWTLQTVGAVRPASNQRLGAQFNFFVLRSRP